MTRQAFTNRISSFLDMETELEIPPIQPFLDLKLRDDKIFR